MGYRGVYKHIRDHFKCWNSLCVNPDHLRPATRLENIFNGRNTYAVRTHCVNGHEFTPENTYFKEDRVKQVMGLKLGLRGAYGYAKPGMPADGRIQLQAQPQAGGS